MTGSKDSQDENMFLQNKLATEQVPFTAQFLACQAQNLR